MTTPEIIHRLKSMSNQEFLPAMARFGIDTSTALGVKIPLLRALAKELGKDHALAQQLWVTGIHEARILASMIDIASQVTEKQMEQRVTDFNSWDLCDQTCSNLFDKTTHAYTKAHEWTSRKEEFVKRAGFVLMACLSVHDKKASDAQFTAFFPDIKREVYDERNFVKKAVNWAIRQIGKRNDQLREAAIALAQEIKHIDSKSAHWIASNALNELVPKSHNAPSKRVA